MADRILEHRDEINVVVSTYELVVKRDDNKFMRKLKPDVRPSHLDLMDSAN